MTGECLYYFTAKDAKDAKENPKSRLLGFSFASFASFAVKAVQRAPSRSYGGEKCPCTPSIRSAALMFGFANRSMSGRGKHTVPP